MYIASEVTTCGIKENIDSYNYKRNILMLDEVLTVTVKPLPGMTVTKTLRTCFSMAQITHFGQHLISSYSQGLFIIEYSLDHGSAILVGQSAGNIKKKIDC